MGRDVVEAVLDDWRTAPVPERMRAMLGFLEKLTLQPADVGPADLRPVRAAGVSDRAIEDAIHVCALFNMILRVADALDFAVPTVKQFDGMVGLMLRRGYA
jgi:uncharacterized peroxidase-related enzyme